MALDSVFAIAPPLVGERNKDTLILNEGEIESEDIKVNGNSEPEDVDLEEGEILDDSEQETSIETPAAEEQIQKKEIPEFENKQKLEQLESYNVGDIEDGSSNKKKKRKKKNKLVNDIDPLQLEAVIKSKTKKQKKKRGYYVDHDRVTDDDPWFERSLSPNCSPTYYRSIRDYHHEYDEDYRGTYGSPGLYDSACNSPSYIRSPYQSPSPFTDYSCNEESDNPNERISKSHHNPSHSQRKSVKRHLMSERGRRKRKANGFRGGPDNKKSKKGKKVKVKRENWKQLCKFYMEGKCHKGADCPYLHDLTPPKKKELCKFYIHGFCAKGEKCLYMHKEFPCKFFHTGAKCYAENNCIFSHDPLTDETKRILDKYLEGTRVDEDDRGDVGGDVMRVKGSERGHSPLKKRPSLLGSPPRHIKEQAESWRQEVQQQQLQHRLKNQMLQQQRQQFSNGGILSPPQNSRERLNFYTDTLQSPKKSSRVMQATSGTIPPLGKSSGLLKLPSSMSPSQEPEEAAKFDHCTSSGYQSKISSTGWFNQDQNYSVHDLSEKEKEDSQLSCNHEPRDSERSLSKYNNETSKHKEQDGVKEQIKEGSPAYNTEEEEETSMGPLSASPPSDTNNSQGANNLICIPTHLPRRQKQLFLRIQQQQKEVGENGAEASEEQDSKPGEEKLDEEEEQEKAEGKSAEWDSSDEDDTEDQPLTAVLKKLQQMPPPKPQLQVKESPATNQPTINIAKMLSAIRQQANLSSSPAVVQAFNQQPEFWQNILAGTAPVPGATSSSALPNPVQTVVENSEKSTVGPLSKDQRIQEVQEAVPSRDPRVGQPHKDPRMQFRDPRFSIGVSTRDPRLGEGVTVTQPVSNASFSSSEPLVSTHSIINSTYRSSTSEKNKNVAKNAHYKLHPVSKSHPNYVTYVIAGNGDPKLFNDPRVRKHLTEVPPPSHLQASLPTQTSLLGKFPESFNNFMSRELRTQTEVQSSLPPLPNLVNPTLSAEVELSEPTENKPITTKPVDPRLTKGVAAVSSDPRLHQNTTNGLIPPHVPSILNQSWLVDNLPNSSVCHLPRSITDPRLAKLHQTGRAGLPLKQLGVKQGTVPQQLGQKVAMPQISCNTVSNGSGGSVFSVSNLPSKPTVDFAADPRLKLNETTDCNSSALHQENSKRSDNTSEKKKPSQLNRNISMEYSSPLNLYNDQSAGSSGNNSYNRRLNVRQAAQTLTTSSEMANIKPSISTFSDPRTQVVQDTSLARTESPGCSSVIFVPEDHLSPEDSGQHASLKEVFKTFDPTVSPFC